METSGYSPAIGFRLMLKPFLGMFDLRTRSTRTEVFAFWIACMLLAVAGVATGWAGAWSWVGFGKRFDLARAIFVEALGLVIWLPLLGLLIRRIHDIGFRAWPMAPIYVFTIVAGQWPEWNWAASGSMVGLPTAFEIPRVLGVLLLYAGLFWPGMRGPNRFGPDPRLDAAT